jgi:aminoglycoside phosphotransferase (APT) family kinase protein
VTTPTVTQALTKPELDAISVALSDVGLELAGPLESALIAGGRSNLTFVISDGSSRWVLRMPPRVGRTASAHDVAREHRVTSALATTGVPVPEAVLLCEDESLLGAPFAVSGYVDGHAVRTQADLAAYDDGRLAAVMTSLVETLVTLHRVDHCSVGLATFGRPDGYAERQLRRWSGQWETVSLPDLQPVAAEVIAKLRSRTPEQLATSIVHGDYRIDNTLLSSDGTVAAVVDWELSTLGDPVADVAMMCAYRYEPFDLVVGAPSAWTSARLPGAEALAARYESCGGVPLVDWNSHLALACFKVAVIAAGIDHRRRAGSGSGAGFDTAGEAVGPFLELARDALAASA